MCERYTHAVFLNGRKVVPWIGQQFRLRGRLCTVNAVVVDEDGRDDDDSRNPFFHIRYCFKEGGSWHHEGADLMIIESHTSVLVFQPA